MHPEPCDEALRPAALGLHCFCYAVTQPLNLKLNTPETGQLSDYCNFNSPLGQLGDLQQVMLHAEPLGQ